MKKALILLAGLAVVLAVAAVAVLPAVVDWNKYEPEIAARLESVLGRPVEIAGELSLSVLPRPELQAGGVRLGGGADRQGFDLESVEGVRLELQFLPLLTGRIVVRELVLEKPVAVVRLDAPQPQAGEAPVEAPIPAEVVTRNGSGGGTDFAIDRLVVRGGAVTFLDDGVAAGRLDAIEAEVAAQAALGPFRGAGAFDWRGQRFTFEAATGDLSGKAAPVSLALRIPENTLDLRLSGQVLLDGDGPSLRGKLATSGDDLRGLAARLGVDQALPPAATGFVVQSQLTASADAVGLNQLTIRIGDTLASGSVTAGFREAPRIETVLSFSSLDLDRWTSPAAPVPAPAAAAGGEAGPATAEAAAAALPEDLTVIADLTADAVVWRGAIMRQARLDASLRGDSLKVRQLSALLPGGSDFNGYGAVRLGEPAPAFDGGFEMASDNLRTVLTWLGIDVSAIPADRLRLFSANGRFDGSSREIHLRELDVDLDTAHIAGAVTIRPGERLAFGANLAADTLNLDAYFPDRARPAAAAGGGPAPAAGAPAGPVDVSVPGWRTLIGAFDANLKARADQLTLNGVTVRDVVVDGTLLNGDVTLRKAAIGEVGGTAAQVSGTVRGLGRGDLVVEGLSYELRSRQPEKAMRLFGLTPPAATERLGAIALTGMVDGGAQGLKVDTRVETAGGVVTLGGRVESPLLQPRYDVAVEASHASMAEVVRLFAPDYRPGGRLGDFALSTRVSGDLAGARFADLRARVGPTNLAGVAELAFAERPKLTARLTAGAVELDPYLPAERQAAGPRRAGVIPASFAAGAEPGARPALRQAATPWSREPVDLGWLRDFDADVAVDGQAVTWSNFRVEKARLEAVLTQGAVRVERFAGDLFGGELLLTGALSADGAAQADLRVAGARMRNAPIELAGLDVTGGILDAEALLRTEGRSMLEMVSRLGGEGRLSVREGTIRGINLGEVSQRLHNIDKARDLLGLLEAGRGGATPFSKLDVPFKVTNGIVSVDRAEMQAEGGAVHGVATVNLPAYTVDARLVFRLTDHPKAPAFVMLLQGPLDEPRRVFETRELQAWLVSRGVGKLVDEIDEDSKVGRIIEQVVPGLLGQPPAAAEPKPEPPARPEPETPQQPQEREPVDPGRRLLEGLIKELGR